MGSSNSSQSIEAISTGLIFELHDTGDTARDFDYESISPLCARRTITVSTWSFGLMVGSGHGVADGGDEIRQAQHEWQEREQYQ